VQRRIFVRVLCLVLFSLTPLFSQEEFSGDFVQTKGNNPGNVGRMYVGKDKIRFESQRKAGDAAVVIMNYDTQTTDILMPERKMYMETTSSQAPGPQRTWTFFRALDVDNACADWLKMVHKPGGTCHKVGSDTVNGRSTVKYEGVSASGEVGNVWLDKSLRFPIKWEAKSGGGEMQNIKEGAQPASLFEIPSDYHKFQMPAGMPGMPPGR
jgi:hypothetical protein